MSKLLPSVQQALEANNIVHSVLECDPDLADTATFCEHYRFTLEDAANTILVASRKVEPTKHALCVVVGTTRLDVNKAVCKQLEVKKASFADAETTKQLTNMMIGGVTIFGVPNIPIFIDSAVLAQQRVVMGGGNRSSKVVLDPKELLKLPNVDVVDGLAAIPAPRI
jgi:prolyl-tRNA editing enzyme YbaK/EbsC (Cys-tRNA(Pro) deacylase)